MTKNKTNPKSVLEAIWKIFDSKFDGVFTKTTQFMLASLEITLSTLMLKSFKNAFINDAEHENDYVRPIFVLFRMEGKREWERMYKDLIANVNYVSDYNVGTEDGKDLVMFVFKVPEKFAEDYYNFKAGKYSRFSANYKAKFSENITSKTKGKQSSVIWKVINKDDSLKRDLEEQFNLNENFLDDQDEIWDKPRNKREVYNF